MIEINVRAFGALKQRFNGGQLRITSETPLTLAELRVKIIQTLQAEDPSLGDGQIIYDSAFANQNSVMNQENEIISQSTDIAILPPVCGG